MEDLVKRGIQAILPIYLKNRGNCTLVYTNNKELILEKTIRTVIKNLCQFYHLDLKASNKTYGDLLSIRKHYPIPFNEENIFIQAKTRSPIGKHDGAYGYINIDSIDKIKGDISLPDISIIHLKSGQSIRVLCKETTLNKNIKYGEIIKRLMIKDNRYMVKEPDSLYLEENFPATKGDIAMLYMELIRIKRGIEL